MLSNRFITKIKRHMTVTHKRSFYDSRTKYDTIFAPLTKIQPPNGSPLAVIKLSGSKTKYVVEQITQRQLIRQEKIPKEEGKKTINPRYAALTKILNPVTGEFLDKGLVLWFPGPNSYTGEDVCELHLHGSQAIISNLLDVLGDVKGLRPAEPGEFTRRSLLNGKISLMQAESLPDLIASQTDNQRRLALKGYDGSTHEKYSAWIEELISILAHLEASIDFGEDELIGEVKVINNCICRINYLAQEIHRFIKASSHCRDLIQGGFKVAILGKPNAGKSTIMNLLCRRNKSIVSSLSGTTRDVVEHSFELGGHRLTLFDTAGLKDLDLQISDYDGNILLQQHANIESEGIKRAIETAKAADIILYVIDGSTFIHDTTKEIAQLSYYLRELEKPKLVHLVINKIDLDENLRNNEAKDKIVMNELDLKTLRVCLTRVSCKTHENFGQLLNQLTDGLNMLTSPQKDDDGSGYSISDIDYVNERHLSLLRSAHRHLGEASILTLDTIDEMAQHVRESVDYLSRIVGLVTNDQVIDVIFRDFCIGK